MKRGFWSLNVEGVNELDDNSREHIAKLISEGFTSGEVIIHDKPKIKMESWMVGFNSSAN